MKNTNVRKIVGVLLAVVLLFGMMPTSAWAYYEEPTAEGNDSLETTVYEYTPPIGATMQPLTGNCVAEFGEDANMGDDFLFVIKSDGRYYAMMDVAAREETYEALPAVDVTDWVNPDGSLTVPADTQGVSFFRYEERPDYELGMFINGREDYISYTYDYESVDGDSDNYNDLERLYSADFRIRTFEEGYWINNPGYWSENGVSGTLQFGGTWQYKSGGYSYTYLKYNLVVDLRSNGDGGKEFYFRYLGSNVDYVGDEVEGYLYYVKCRHQGTVRHAEYDAPTCMLKGCEEYWYCENCNRYFKDEAFSECFGEVMPVIPATGHDWGTEKCGNCNRPVPVYTKVTNQADFDALAEDTMFILVAEYGGKYYVPDLSEVYLYMIDTDGDGYYDIHDVDENENGIPDYLEFDEGGGGEWKDEPNGVYDYLEWDMDGDGDVDEEDLLEFHYMTCEGFLTDLLYNNSRIGAAEVTANPDGTFSHEAVKATVEFEMLDTYYDVDPEYFEDGVMPFNMACVKQFAIPNMFITAPSMAPQERFYRQYTYDFGDSHKWGVIFYDNRDEYYYFPDGDTEQKTSPLPFHEVCQPGSVAVFDTFDDYWNYYDERQMAQLRLRDYEGEIAFVTGHVWELDGWEWVEDPETGEGYYDTHDTQAGVYLYASQQPSHICEFADWQDDENGRTHTGTCECGETKTVAHGWDDGVETAAPDCTTEGETTYTCEDCGAEKTAPIAPLQHDWSDWADDGEGADTHTRTCLRAECDEREQEAHGWGEWTPDGDGVHKKICSDCRGVRTEQHAWDDGVETVPPTEEAEGEMTYTCTVCEHERTEPIAKLPHVHEWGDWVQEDEENHVRSCRCEEKQTEAHRFDDGVVINWETHLAPGARQYTCTDCGFFYDEEIPPLAEHEWGDWVANDDGRTHTRVCICNADETLPHNWSGWAEHPAGGFARACADCGATETMVLDEERPVNTTPAETVANTNLSNTDIELIDKVLTDEEQSQAAAGAQVKVYLKVEDITDAAPAEHKAEAEAAAGDGAIGLYLDIDLFKQVGTAEETAVTETAGTVLITITIPEELINTDDSVTRVYTVVRVHEDEHGNLLTDVIEGKFNPDDNTFTFETDKFSTYALAYADEKADGLFGDVNKDGKVDSTDARLTLQYAVKKISTLSNLAAADVNGDGKVDSTDARIILQYAVKKIQKFPVEG